MYRIRSEAQIRVRIVAVVGAVIILAGLIGGCSSAPAATFDPSSPCTTDVKASGAYPVLEARIPKAFQGRGPDQLDSGRNCTDANLGTLTGHGIHEVRFAGGLWRLGSTSGITLAVFQGDGLTPAMLGEWYEASARDARNTTSINPTRPIVAGRQAYRLDTVNNDSNQTVIVWPSASGDVVQVVLAADAPEATIQAAVAALG